jgi:hypothetical protein
MDAHRRLADSSGEHMTQFLSVVWVFLFVGVVYFLYATADRRLVPLHTIVLVGLGAFSMVAILTVGPFDVALTLVGRRSDSDSTRVDSFERHSKVLRKMYVDVYWICFAMSLAGLPYAEEYDASGHVAALGKLLDSGRRMAVMWLAMGLCGLLFLGLGVVDLRLVVGVGAAVDDADDARFDLELADRSMKLKACDGDAASWIAALHAWRDRAVERDGLSGLLAFDAEDAAPRDQSSSAAPPPLEGALALKKPHKFRADTWARRYVVVDGSKGELALFYSAADAKAPGKRPYLAFDLRVCGAFAKHDKGAKSDPARFSVDVGDHSVKLKAPTAQDADAWVAGLREWQDHILLGTAASMV